MLSHKFRLDVFFPIQRILDRISSWGFQMSDDFTVTSEYQQRNVALRNKIFSLLIIRKKKIISLLASELIKYL